MPELSRSRTKLTKFRAPNCSSQDRQTPLRQVLDATNTTSILGYCGAKERVEECEGQFNPSLRRLNSFTNSGFGLINFKAPRQLQAPLPP
ncbi:hypothetical protein GJAV_G00074140 [Gymnothorax javanicus]|nr:hypothetical protein GJAV_G00074140 [Gymnothorax javanicus]